jgi:hypothetical protein
VHALTLQLRAGQSRHVGSILRFCEEARFMLAQAGVLVERKSSLPAELIVCAQPAMNVVAKGVAGRRWRVGGPQ